MLRSRSLRRLAAPLLAPLTIALVAGPALAADAPPSAVKPPAPASAPAPATGAPGVDLQKAEAFAQEVDNAVVKAVGSVCESSVTVWNLQRRPVKQGEDPGPPIRMGGGSGVIVTIKGQGPFIITNEHVVKGAAKLEIAMYDGSTWDVRLKDHVPTYDIALLEFEKAKPKLWKAAKLGKSEALVEGQWVVATGNPFFLGGDGRCVATFGVISGLDRTVGGEFMYANAIQHDAEVNPGNSGGPLWNLSGELIGINGLISSRGGGSTLGASNTGASFAIPIHLIQRYFDSLLSDKVDAAAGYLGLDVDDAKDPAGKPMGARVGKVRDDSPVKKADAKTNPPTAGDLITQISLGTAVTMKAFPVYSVSDLTNAVALYPAGTKVRIAYTRGDKKMSWSGELGGAAPKPPPPAKPGGRK